MAPELEQSRRPKPPKPNTGGTGCLLEVPSLILGLLIVAGPGPGAVAAYDTVRFRVPRWTGGTP